MVTDEEHSKLKEEYLKVCHELGELKEKYSTLKSLKKYKDMDALKENQLEEARNG